MTNGLWGGSGISPTLGPSLFGAPSDTDGNAVAVLSDSLRDLLGLAESLKKKGEVLKWLVREVVPKAQREFSGALATMLALEGIGDLLVLTAPNYLVGGRVPDGLLTRATEFRDRAHALHRAAQDKTPAKTARSVMKGLDDGVMGAAQEIVNMLHDPPNVAIVERYGSDVHDPADAAEAGRRWATLAAFDNLVAELNNLINDAEHKGAKEFADDLKKAVEDDNFKGSVPIVIIGEAKKAWDVFVSGSAALTNAIGPDSTLGALLKIWGTYRMPQAAMSKAAAASLEQELVQFIIKSIKLEPERAEELQKRLATLKEADARVIKAQLKLQRDLERLPDHERKISRRKNQVAQSDAERDEAAKAVRELYRDSYGPGEESEKIYSSLQRGPFIDGFLAALTIAQLFGAWNELGDPTVSTPRAVEDLIGFSAASVGSGLALAESLSKVDFVASRNWLIGMDELAPAVGSFTTPFAAIMSVFAGTAMIFEGYEENNAEKEWIGGFTVASGAGIALGAMCGSSFLSGGGFVIGVGIALYTGYEALVDAMKPKTQRVLEGAIQGLKKQTSWNGVTIVDLLGLKGELEALEEAAEAAGFNLPAAPNGSPTRDELIARLKLLKLPAVEEMVESQQDVNQREAIEMMAANPGM